MFVAKIPLAFFTSRLSVAFCHLDSHSEGARGTRFGGSNAERVARNDELLEAIERERIFFHLCDGSKCGVDLLKGILRADWRYPHYGPFSIGV